MLHSVHDITINQFSRSLEALKVILLKAEDHANLRKFKPDLLLELRIAPDMFPLVRQVQMACDTAKFAAARMSAKTAPIHPDDEKTLRELINRIDKTLDYLTTFTKADFTNYATEKITFPWVPGKYIEGGDFFESHAIPNFYFHVTAVYMLLRAAGVEIGKGDFLGNQNWKS